MVVSVMHMTGRVLPGMRERKWGRVLMMTSTGVKQPIPILGISNTLRASLMNWAKTISLEVAADGVTVNMIMPGRITTDRTRQLDGLRAEREGRSIEEIRAESCGQIPMGRYGNVEEFGAVAAFLASERASYVTGVGLAVDGGMIRAS
jgi:3-oxoacyl-[acyl-carrier protein] reductase